MIDKIVLPTVSVIIPFYSNADWLDEAIESAIKQTYKPYEIIVINDGSKEDISEIVQKYQAHVKFIFQKNGGAARARNHGIDEANGEIIAFLDSDDKWKQDKLFKQISLMEKENLAWSATAYETFGTEKTQRITPYKYNGLCWEHMYNACRIGTPTVAIRRDILMGSRFAEDMRNGQDTFLWFKLSCTYKLGVVEEPLVYVRMRNGSTVRRLDAHIRNRAILWEKMHFTHELIEPKRLLTKIAYITCWNIRKKDPEIKNTLINKLKFLFAWSLWRIDNCILEMKYKRS